jgi:hypothetical protein
LYASLISMAGFESYRLRCSELLSGDNQNPATSAAACRRPYAAGDFGLCTAAQFTGSSKQMQAARATSLRGSSLKINGDKLRVSSVRTLTGPSAPRAS